MSSINNQTSGSSDNLLQQAHLPQIVNTSRAGDGMMLVKVPKYLAELWLNAEPDSQIGRIVHHQNTQNSGSKSKVVLYTSDKLLPQSKGKQIPTEHDFIVTPKVHQSRAQSMHILSDQLSHKSSSQSGLSLFGQVMERAECRPPSSDTYMRLKKLQVEASNRPDKQLKSLSNPVKNFKPVSDHKNNIEWQEKLKKEGKNLRRDKEDVKNDLFKAFERHQYYTIKDLVTITKQPVPYLKEILKDIASYNTRPPHRCQWELKPEYRHYKNEPSNNS